MKISKCRGGAGEVVWGEVIAGAADGFDASVFGARTHQEVERGKILALRADDCGRQSFNVVAAKPQ